MRIRESETLFMVICVSLVFLGIYVLTQRQQVVQQPQSSSEIVRPINNATELSATLSELDTSDLNQFDQGILQNNTDATAF